MRHIWSETWTGLRRNGAITASIIVTMWVSLTLLGAGLLLNQQVSLMKGSWYDQIEISVFLCNTETVGENCTPGRDVTEDERTVIKQTLDSNPEVAEVFHETKEEAYREFRRTNEDSPILDSVTVDQMQESYRVKLVNPEEYQTVVAEVAGLPGVENIQDLRQWLDPLFRLMFMIQVGAWVTSGLLLLAAMLQIGTTIRMVAFARRRELAIMRLVGAGNGFIMMPMLLQILIASLIGALLAAVTLVTGVYLLITRNSEPSSQTSALIGWDETLFALGGLAIVAVVLSILPTLLATRRYLRV